MREGGKLAFYADEPRLGDPILPTRGFLLPFAYKANWRQFISSGAMQFAADWQYVQVASRGDYEIQIMRVCDGRLSRKEATLRQWGYVFNWGEANYRFARKGVLEWAALDIDCGSDQKIRFEKGPAYGVFTPGYKDNRLLDWMGSYEALAM